MVNLLNVTLLNVQETANGNDEFGGYFFNFELSRGEDVFEITGEVTMDDEDNNKVSEIEVIADLKIVRTEFLFDEDELEEAKNEFIRNISTNNIIIDAMYCYMFEYMELKGYYVYDHEVVK